VQGIPGSKVLLLGFTLIKCLASSFWKFSKSKNRWFLNLKIRINHLQDPGFKKFSKELVSFENELGKEPIVHGRLELVF